MKRILLTGLSLTAVTIGLSVAGAPASAETATGVYGVVDTTAVSTDASGKSYIFSADGDLKVQDSHNIGAGVAGTTTQDYEMKSGSGTFADGTGTVLDRDIGAGQAIVTTTDNTGTLTFENTAGNRATVTGSVGEADKALKAIVGSAGGASFTSDVFTKGLTVTDGDMTVGGMLSGGTTSADVEFTTDNILMVGGNANLGDVTGVANGGVLGLSGQTNTITEIKTGLKALNLGGAAGSTTTISGAVAGLDDAAIAAGNSLILAGASGVTAEITTTTLVGADSVFNVGDVAVTGDVVTAIDGAGTVVIGKGTGSQTVTSLTGEIGAANNAVGSILYMGGTADVHTVSNTGAAYAKNVTIAGAGNLILDGGLKSSTNGAADVVFSADGTLTMGGESALGAVVVAADNTGTIHLDSTNADAHSANSIGAAGARLKKLEISATGTAASLSVASDSWINDLVLSDDGTNAANAAFLGNANLGKVTEANAGKNALTLMGANNVVGEIGTTGSDLGILNLGTGTTWVTGTDDGAGNIDGGANVKTMTLANGETVLNLGAGTTNVFEAIGTDITNDALKSLSLGAGSATEISTGGVFSQRTVLLANDMAGGSASLKVDQAGSNLGGLTFGLGYDNTGSAFNLGEVDASGQTLSVSGINVGASNAAAEGLAKAWSARGDDTAVLAGGDALKFNSLTLGDGTTAVTFAGDALKAGATDYNTADNLVVNDNLAMWNFALGQTGGANASLLAVQDGGGFRSNVASGANMANFGGVADGMVSVVNDANADPALQQFISGLTTGQASTVAQQMADTSVNNSVVGAVRTTTQAASNAITANIGGGTGTSVASNAVASGINAGDTTKRNTAWLQVIGSWSDQGRRKGVDGYTADTYGFALGADTLVAEKTRIGLALHYANTNVDGKGVFASNSSEINTYGVTLYGQQGLTDDLFLDGRLGYAYNDVSSDRRISGLGGKADGSYGAHQFDVAAKLGYNAKVASNATLTPHVGLGYTYLGEDSYTEGGNAARLNVGSRDTSALLIGAGVRGAVEFTTSDKTRIIPELRLGASYDALASDFNTTARFVGGGTAFTTRNVKPDPWTFNVGAGVNVATTGNITVSANYDAALSTNFTGHTGSLRGKLTF